MLLNSLNIFIISILYAIMIYYIGDYNNHDLETIQRIDLTIKYILYISIISIILLHVYYKKSKYYNNEIYTGIFGGSIIMLSYIAYTIYENIFILDKNSKLIIIGGLFSSVIYFTNYKNKTYLRKNNDNILQ